MRMAKRIAVSLLAAAMALTMLTACGGSNQPEQPANSNSGNNSTTEPAKPEPGKDDSTEKPGDEKPAQDDTTRTRYAETRTANYFASRNLAQDNVYLKAALKISKREYPIVYARKGQAARYQRNFSSIHPVTETVLGQDVLAINGVVYEMSVKDKQYSLYTDYYDASEWKMEKAANRIYCADGEFVIPANDGDIVNIETGTYDVDGKTYYAEKIRVKTDPEITFDATREYIYCFEKNGNDLKYIVHEENCQDNILIIKTMHSDPDSDLLEIPVDYKPANSES